MLLVGQRADRWPDRLSVAGRHIGVYFVHLSQFTNGLGKILVCWQQFDSEYKMPNRRVDTSLRFQHRQKRR
jgi:hypothetical protein